jgi:hypothetical protein
MILITYTILLPAGNTIQSLIATAPELANKMRVQAAHADALEECEIVIDYDPIDNKFVTVYRWSNQQAIDNFIEWANSNVGNYNTTMSEFTALVDSIGGSLVRTVETI